jgi:sigma-B regulation protein RsbU (phosphoserine phosphatase)
MTTARVVVAVEAAALAVTLAVLLTGDRAAYFDRFGARADVAVVVAAIAVFGVVHAIAFAKLVPSIERRLAPPAYDEHRVLLDLGYEARLARDVDQLYGLVVSRIGEILLADAVSILVRDDETGAYRCRVSTRPAGDPAASLALPGEAFVVRRLRGLATPLPVGPADLETWERAFAEAAPGALAARAAECDALRRAGTRLLVQIRTRDQMIGVLVLAGRATRHDYTDADREMLSLAAGQLALIIENEKMLERAVGEERLRRELALAAEVQRRLLPDGAPEAPGLDLAGACEPARGVGGDYYDFLELGGGCTGIAIADVSGKGVSAALVMSSVHAYLRSQTIAEDARPASGLGDVVARVNLLLCRSTAASTYVTFFYAQYDAATRRLDYVNAGHNQPLVVRPGSGEVRARLAAGGPVLGVFESPAFEQGTIDLEPGDVVVAYTDGVTEALDRDGEEFGEERLIETIEAVAGRPAGEIRDAVIERVGAWAAGAAQHDDLTLVIARAE